MSNEQQNTREAAIEQPLYTKENIERFRQAGEDLFHQGFTDLSQLMPVERLGYEIAQLRAAASIDRVEIVREAFEEVKKRCEHGNYAFVMDAVIAAIEGKR